MAVRPLSQSQDHREKVDKLICLEWTLWLEGLAERSLHDMTVVGHSDLHWNCFQHCHHCTYAHKRNSISSTNQTIVRTMCTLSIQSYTTIPLLGGSVAEWLACWTQKAQKGRIQIAVTKLSGNSLMQIVHTHCASVHQAAKLVAALLRVVGVTAGLAESNGSLLPGLWLTSPAGWLPRTGISSGTLHSVIEYELPLPFYY